MKAIHGLFYHAPAPAVPTNRGLRQATHAEPLPVHVRLLSRRLERGRWALAAHAPNVPRFVCSSRTTWQNHVAKREIFSRIGFTSISSGTCTSQPWFLLPLANAS